MTIIDDCRDILKRHNNFKVVFIRLQVNDIVHTLARTSISYAFRKNFHYAYECIMNLFPNSELI